MAKTKPGKKTGGPYLAAAVFCESIIEDQRRLTSALGILDGLQILIPAHAPEDFPSVTKKLPVTLNILLMFKTGDSPGKHTLRLVVEQPNGKKSEMMSQEIELAPEPHSGGSVRSVANLGIFSSGLFWIDVFLDSKRLTRMPINIDIKRAEMPFGPDPGKS
jgi:hypothetical protein